MVISPDHGRPLLPGSVITASGLQPLCAADLVSEGISRGACLLVPRLREWAPSDPSPVCWPEQSCPGSVAPSPPTNVTVQLASEPLYPRPVLSYPADVSQCDGIRVVGSGRPDPPHLFLLPPLLSHRR